MILNCSGWANQKQQANERNDEQNINLAGVDKREFSNHSISTLTELHCKKTMSHPARKSGNIL